MRRFGSRGILALSSDFIRLAYSFPIRVDEGVRSSGISSRVEVSLLERVFDLRVHVTFAILRPGLGYELSRMGSSRPREHLPRPTQYTCLGPARHVRMTLLMRKHVRSDARIILQICPQTEPTRLIPDSSHHARDAYLTAFIQAVQLQTDANFPAFCRFVQARHRGVAAPRVRLRGVRRKILERARGFPETGEFDNRRIPIRTT